MASGYDTFTNYWLEDKLLPIFDASVVPQAVPLNIVKHELSQEQQQRNLYDPPTTQSLLKEFENVFDTVNAVGSAALTPPQSPPYSGVSSALLTPLQPPATQQQTNTANYAVIQSEHAYPINVASLPDGAKLYHRGAEYARGQEAGYATERYVPSSSPVASDYSSSATASPTYESPANEFPTPGTPLVGDVLRELAVVDELIRSRVQFMVPSSPGCASTTSSGEFASSEYGGSSSDDPDWVPETVDLDELRSAYQGTEPVGAIASSSAGITKKRTKPYARNVEDKKSRKKEQNKNAATRYRLKKKAEVEEILGEERELQGVSQEMTGKITDLEREIKYIKGLMRELFKAKGLIQ